MSHPVISAKHVEECPVQKKGCPAAPLPFTSLYFLFSWSILTPLIISPTLLAFNIIYVPMIPNIYFQHLLTLELQIHTQQPPGPLHMAMYQTSQTHSLQMDSCSCLSARVSRHSTSTPSFQVFRPPERGVNLHCFLSLILHIPSVFLQRSRI